MTFTRVSLRPRWPGNTQFKNNKLLRNYSALQVRSRKKGGIRFTSKHSLLVNPF